MCFKCHISNFILSLKKSSYPIHKALTFAGSKRGHGRQSYSQLFLERLIYGLEPIDMNPLPIAFYIRHKLYELVFNKIIFTNNKKNLA